LPEKRQQLLSEFISELRARKERLEKRRAKAKLEATAQTGAILQEGESHSKSDHKN
jgi:hypothetical protein